MNIIFYFYFLSMDLFSSTKFNFIKELRSISVSHIGHAFFNFIVLPIHFLHNICLHLVRFNSIFQSKTLQDLHDKTCLRKSNLAESLSYSLFLTESLPSKFEELS